MMFMYKIKKSLYYSATLLLYLSYLAIFFGIYTINPEYLKTAIHILELIISLVLIIRFHPFQKASLDNYDQQLIFLSATILLTNLGFTNYLLTKINKAKDVFSSEEMWERLLMRG